MPRSAFVSSVAVLLCVLPLCLVPGQEGGKGAKAKPTPVLLPDAKATATMPVTVEIFTSEGCSSCPPAEHFVNILVKEARAKGLPVYCLSWHVDVWDKLRTKHGVWKDRFSDQRWTKRAREYSVKAPRHPKLKGRLVTPSIMIGGKSPNRNGMAFPEYFGGLLAAEAAPYTVSVTGTVDKESRKAKLQLTAQGDVAKDVDLRFVVALVERGLETKITKGENHGRTLAHENVVREADYVTPEQADAGKVIEHEMAIPADVDLAKAGFIVLAEDAKTMTMVHAARFDIPSGGAAAKPADGEKLGAFKNLLNTPGDKIGDCTTGVCVEPAAEETAKVSK